MTASPDPDKWNRIYAAADHGDPQVANVLQQNLHLLPFTGKALDVACGLGANALLLAQCGLQTWAWDISQTAIEKLQSRSLDLNILLQLETRDVTARPPEPLTFDVIVVSRFLERTLIPALIAALRDGGLIYYQTFIKNSTSDAGPRNPDYRLGSNELLGLFQSLQIVFYREEGRLGDLDKGMRNEAMLIAQRSLPHG